MERHILLGIRGLQLDLLKGIINIYQDMDSNIPDHSVYDQENMHLEMILMISKISPKSTKFDLLLVLYNLIIVKFKS